MRTKNLRRFFALTFCTHLIALYGSPNITDVTPLSGPVAGGNVVTLSGQGFTGATEVNFGSESATSFIVINDTILEVVAPRHVPQALEITVVTPTGTSPLNPPKDYYTYQGDWFAYIPDFGSANVYPINVRTQLEGAPIPVGAGANTVVVTPNGKSVLCVNSESNNLSIIDVATQTVVNTLSLGTSFPIFVVNPVGTQAIVVNYSSNNATLIDLNTLALTTIAVGSAPTGVAIDHAGQYAYVTNSGSSSLTQINLSTLTTVTIPAAAGSIPSFIEILPNSNTALITDDATDSVVLFDLTTLTLGTRITGFSLHGANLYPQVAVTPDGTTAWVANTSSNTISSIVGLDTATPTFGSSIVVDNGANGIAITPDGSQAYVSNATTNNISIATLAIASAIALPVGVTPTDTAITPDQAPVAYFSPSSPSGHQFIFDASNSLSPVGTIATYAWNFGDGTAVVTTTSPEISHTYASPGSYSVTLTVTNTAGTSTMQNYTGGVMLNNGGPSATLTEIVTLLPAPPSDFEEHRCKNTFATQTEYVHKLSWKASTDSTVVKYLLYRNGKLIATIPSTSSLKFVDHDRPKKNRDVYTLVAVDASGLQSTPITIE